MLSAVGEGLPLARAFLVAIKYVSRDKKTPACLFA